jgi:hypothetical protein
MGFFAMKPDFEKMSKAELKAYVLAHKNDNEAFYQLVDRWKAETKDRVGYPYPKTSEEIAIMEEAIQERIRQIKES